MTLAFTICSINYLAQARTLGDSLRQTNPSYQYIIGLVDKLSDANLPAELIPAYPMIEVDKIGIPDFAAMCDRYDITELNTAVKPFFIDYFYQSYPEATEVIYFDPDIIVFQPLEELNEALTTYSLVLTPHTCSPTPDWERPNEQHHLNTGIFNLGFIGLRNDATARKFVNWWKDRLVYECRIDLCEGLFVDQHWVNFAPVYFDNVLIDHHLGYNVAYWNLHERYFSKNEAGQWQVTSLDEHAGQSADVNEGEPLQFFHYSGYHPERPNEISKYQTRFSFGDSTPQKKQRPDVKPLFDLYRERLIANHNDQYRTYPCIYIKPPVVLRYLRVRKLLKTPFNRVIALLESR
ncbi:glycosyl transferase [Spirosoma sp. KCTC 42546]|uniref:glycosyl transferase n=1 Tax=Spirosoma sp. KCTC 42546 TaxID=2520506 RepID=UPI001156E3FC|nr:glycosyl transferase [Spirosoma sp. KCTC 42546]QDK79613.1 glycosyl transferase [Spirosoma sp. KCTC 42546]